MTGSKIDPSNAYSGYETWKGWGELFAFSPDDARAFAGETRGLSVAASEVLEIGFDSGAFLAWAARSLHRIRVTSVSNVLTCSAGVRYLILARMSEHIVWPLLAAKRCGSHTMDKS
jgi:hypothetical protein